MTACPHLGFLKGLRVAPLRDLQHLDKHNVPEAAGAYILLAEVDKTLGVVSLQMYMGGEMFLPSVSVQLRPSENDKAMKLRKGEAITFTGVLDDWGTILPTSLTRGEIVGK